MKHDNAISKAIYKARQVAGSTPLTFGLVLAASSTAAASFLQAWML